MKLRLLVYDATCEGEGLLPGLSTVWRAGSYLYRGLDRIDAAFGARTWAEALDFLAHHGEGRPLAEVQYWGHGNFGKLLLGRDALDARGLSEGPHVGAVDAVVARMEKGEDGLLWLRTCEAFGGRSGHGFARALASRFGCRVAGHTHVIGVLQSGLETLLPGEEPGWPEEQGVTPAGEGATGRPSLPGEPHTVSFLTGSLPDSIRGSRR